MPSSPPPSSFPSLPHFQEEEDRPEAQRPTVHYSSPLQGERGALPRFRPAAPRVIYLCAKEVIAVTAVACGGGGRDSSLVRGKRIGGFDFQGMIFIIPNLKDVPQFDWPQKQRNSVLNADTCILSGRCLKKGRGQ